ncbi:MAG: prealbumin-like fold domain-containing protein, partial [Defluviitaleaceae bacterium]|nr:prealbumin-like fold domain-containing protein [Defluviitaleaceae bacterium]
MKRQFNKCISLVLAFLVLFTSVYSGSTVYADEGLYLVESEYEYPEYYPEQPENEVATEEEVAEDEYLVDSEYEYPEYYPEQPENEATTEEEVTEEENEYSAEPEYEYPEYYPEQPENEATTDEEVTEEENEYSAEPEYGYPEYYPEYPEDEVITDEYLDEEEYEYQEYPHFIDIQPLTAGSETLPVRHVDVGSINYSNPFYNYSVRKVEANGNPSFCIEPGVDDRQLTQTYEGRFLDRAGNELLFKSLYYLYEGPGWPEFQHTFYRYIPRATAISAYGYSRLIILESVNRLNHNIIDSGSRRVTPISDIIAANPTLHVGINAILRELGQQPMPHDGFRVFVYGEYSVVGDHFQAYVSWEDQRGIIRVRKYDPNPSMSVHPIEGAVFTVRNANNVVVDTIITGADGHGQSRILPFGTYTVTETQAPYGFILNPVSETVTLSRPARTG